MKNKKPKKQEIIFYSSPQGDIKIEVFFADETVWLSQKRMAELFNVEVNTINYHLKEAYSSKELEEKPTIRKIRIVQKELKALNLVVNIYLDYAELQARKQIPMHMKDWIGKLDAFLEFNEYQILHDKGKISAEVARKLAEEQYERFRVEQDKNYISDFDKMAGKYLKGKDGK